VKTRVRGPMERLSWRLRFHRGGNLVEHGVGRPSCWKPLLLCNLRGLPGATDVGRRQFELHSNGHFCRLVRRCLQKEKKKKNDNSD
jgi:hypothetical protein